MSAKNLDKHDRFRCIIVGFRVSPEEHETINRIVALSGLTKQEYCYRKCTDREIVVEGNPRVYKALKVRYDLRHDGFARCSRRRLHFAKGEAHKQQCHP